jgi:hypothetical protein
MDRLLVLTSQAGGDIQNFRDTPDDPSFDYNVTGTSNTDTSMDTTTKNVSRVIGIVILWVLVFFMLSTACYCIKIDKDRRLSQANTASDNNTIASKEDAEDVEAPTTTNANEDDDEGTETEIPVVVVMVSPETE